MPKPQTKPQEPICKILKGKYTISADKYQYILKREKGNNWYYPDLTNLFLDLYELEQKKALIDSVDLKDLAAKLQANHKEIKEELAKAIKEVAKSIPEPK